MAVRRGSRKHAAQVRVGEQAVIVGKDSAGTKVVVYEDFASPESRELAIASRDFLQIEAARGSVEVEYRPIAVEDDSYSRDAITAWAGVLRAGTPTQALTFHDELFDRQPDPGSDVMPEFAHVGPRRRHRRRPTCSTPWTSTTRSSSRRPTGPPRPQA